MQTAIRRTEEGDAGAWNAFNRLTTAYDLKRVVTLQFWGRSIISIKEISFPQVVGCGCLDHGTM
jgi:hypothetical protein